jgi:hypothetical protein
MDRPQATRPRPGVRFLHGPPTCGNTKEGREEPEGGHGAGRAGRGKSETTATGGEKDGPATGRMMRSQPRSSSATGLNELGSLSDLLVVRKMVPVPAQAQTPAR